MTLEQADAVAATVAPSAPARAPRRVWPPDWLIAALALAYVGALAGLAFWPGATLLDRLRALDGGICAQIPSHTLVIANQMLPLCSRNTGIYMGFAATFLFLLATGRLRSALLPGKWVALVLGVAVLFMAEDGFNSLFLDLRLPHLYQPHNIIRLFSGLGTGAAMAAFIIPVANTLIWRDEDERSSFGSLRALAPLGAVLLLVFLAVGSQAAPLLYPIAILSTAGVVVALSLVNVVFVLGFTNRTGRFATWRQFFPVYSIAVVFAILELMALFALKSALLQGMTLPK